MLRWLFSSLLVIGVMEYGSWWFFTVDFWSNWEKWTRRRCCQKKESSNLGKWVSHAKYDYKTGRMSAERMVLIENIFLDEKYQWWWILGLDVFLDLSDLPNHVAGIEKSKNLIYNMTWLHSRHFLYSFSCSLQYI